MAETIEKSLQHLSDAGKVDVLREFLLSSQNTEALIHPKSKTKRGLAKKMTGMINSIKDAFPTFEDEQEDGES